MNPQRFDRFSQPQFLQHIGRERVTALLSPFADELLGLGILLPALALPDEAFFFVLATLPRQAAQLSARLLEAMMAIEVVEEMLPDERPAAPWPLVVSELRLRLGAQQRPVLLVPAAQQGLLDGGMYGLVESAVAAPLANVEPHFIVTVGTEPQPGCEPHGPRSGTSNIQHSTLNTEMGTAREVFADGHCARPTKARARFKFRQKGSVCVVRFDGGERFHLANTDGAKYLDHLLHRPNEVIRAFDLERAVKPDKAAAREANSIQRVADGRTLREAREELLELEAELATAEAEGLTETCERLGLEIAQIKKLAGKKSLLTSDTGERARNNVRKAIGKVIAKLRKGGVAEQTFAQHLMQSISLGYDVVYTQPAGKIWS